VADQRITQLNALPKAGVAATDVLPIADISASETKKVTAKDLVAAGIDLVDNGEIDLAKLDQNSATKLGTAALADDAVTYAKLQNVSATDRLLGRSSAGAGNVEEIPLTAAGRALLDDANAAAQRTTLGLGTLATQSGTFSGTHSGTTSGTNTGDQTITLTGDVTGSGTGSFAATIANDAVTYAKIQNTATSNVVLGRSSAGGGNVEEIACTAAGRALLDDADAAAQRTTLGLGTIATQNANAVAVTGGTATLSSLSANSVTISGGTITGITDLAVADGGTGASDAATARSNLGLTIGTNVQAYDAGLNSIAGLTTTANQTVYTTGADTYAVTGLTAAGRALLDDATAADQRTTLGLGSVATANQVSTALIQDDAVNAAKLANESTVDFVTTLPASGEYLGQLARVTSDDKLYCWDGATWVSIKAAGSVNTITGGVAGVVNVTATASGDTVTIGTTLDNTSAAGQFLAGPSSAAGAVTYRIIDGVDLPTATTGAKGGVIVNGNGLTMSGDTIAVNNTVTAEASNFHVVQYNNKGLITGGRQIIGADVPVASASSIGVVRPGSGLGVDGAGTLNHSNSITPGSAAKVTYDGEGHVVAALALVATDIPELDASKITTGTFASERLAPNSVTASQLADYGIAQVGSSQPVPEFAGQLWINPTDRTAYVWVGQVSPAQGYYLPLNNEFGAQANLRFGGTYNASTNTISSLNTYGSSSGLTVGSALVAPTAASSGLYLLVTTAGTGTSPAPAVALDVGDWILSPGSGTTWTHVNIVGAGISVIDANDVTFSGGALSPPMTGVANAQAALTTLWGRSQIATPSTLGIVLETTEIVVNNTTGAMTVGVVDEGTY
jgi:hypothetical protein